MNIAKNLQSITPALIKSGCWICSAPIHVSLLRTYLLEKTNTFIIQFTLCFETILPRFVTRERECLSRSWLQTRVNQSWRASLQKAAPRCKAVQKSTATDHVPVAGPHLFLLDVVTEPPVSGMDDGLGCRHTWKCLRLKDGAVADGLGEGVVHKLYRHRQSDSLDCLWRCRLCWMCFLPLAYGIWSGRLFDFSLNVKLKPLRWGRTAQWMAVMGRKLSAGRPTWTRTGSTTLRTGSSPWRTGRSSILNFTDSDLKPADVILNIVLVDIHIRLSYSKSSK